MKNDIKDSVSNHKLLQSEITLNQDSNIQHRADMVNTHIKRMKLRSELSLVKSIHPKTSRNDNHL